MVVPREIDGVQLVKELELETGAPVIVMLGGAAELAMEGADRLQSLVMYGVARAASELGATVVDGGSDVGVMGMLDAGLATAGHGGNYVGVAPAAKVSGVAAGGGCGWPIGVHHTHVVLVEGDHFGDETRAMYGLIETLSRDSQSLAILANGGTITQDELAFNVRQGREVIVMSGSGRLADQIAQALRGQHTDLGDIAESGQFTVFEASETPEDLALLIRTKLQEV